MARIYKKLFSVELNHGYYNDEMSRDFVFSPTRECAQNLKNFALLFRSRDSGFDVYYERNTISDEINRQITKETRFSFLARFSVPHFGNYTDLGDPGELISNQRRYYFSNIDPATGDIDFDLDSEFKMFLSVGAEVGAGDACSLVSPLFTLPIDGTVFNEIEAFRILANEPKKKIFSIEIEDEMTSVQLDFRDYPDGKYQLRWLGSSSKVAEIYMSRELLKTSAFGIIEIFKDDQVDYDNPSQYFLEFKRNENIWKYFVVQKSDAPEGTLAIVYDPEPGANPSVYPAGLTFQQIGEGDQSDDEKKVIAALDSSSQDVFLFRSDQPIPSYERALTGIKLRKISPSDVKTLINNMPNPTTRSIKSEIFVNI